MKSQKLCTAARYVAVAAEVSIDLPGESVGPQQDYPEIGASELAAESRVRDQCTVVCNHTFAQQSGENQHQTIKKAIAIEGPLLLNLREEMLGPLNGACNQVRKKTDE